MSTESSSDIGAARRRRTACVVGTIAALSLLGFLRQFDWQEAQYGDALWFLAIGAWVTSVCLWPQPGRSVWPWRAGDAAPIGAFLLVFVCAWLPFYDNWRWAFTGDSFGIFSVGYWFGKNGPPDSLLSVRGIDNFYTRLWELAYNWLQWVVAPTLFWHRVSQLVMACLALASIFGFYTLVLGRWWAMAVVLATATNYLFVWISYISYQRTDSFVFYYTTLTAGLLLWRYPERLGPWLVAGLAGGLSLLFTPVVWGAVAWVALINGCVALWHRRLAGIVVYSVSFLLGALPMLLELPWMVQMLTEQSVARGADTARVLPSIEYLWTTARIILVSAYDSPIHQLGAMGAFLRYPLGHLYCAGIAVAVVGFVGPVRRGLRIPAAAPALLLLLCADAALFALTNKNYGLPSHKRFYNLIPLQIFFALLPLYLVGTWLGVRDRLRLIPLATAAAIASAAVIGFQLIRDPEPHVYGHNTFDGLIEIRQRMPDVDVLLFTKRPIAEHLAKDSLFHQAYGIGERITLVEQMSRDALPALCKRNLLLCHEVISVADEGNALFTDQPDWQEIDLLNTFEMRCHSCVSANR